jgi:predicted HTH transcriptional regulator
VEYVVALANAGGGKIILGVTDKRPRNVVGTHAFAEPGRAEAGLFERLQHRVPIEEVTHEGHRLLIVTVPSREPGMVWEDRGVAWSRAGDALVPLSDHQRRLIYLEAAELRQVLPTLSESAVQRLLDELRSEGRVDLTGSRRWARWRASKTKADVAATKSGGGL